MRMAIVNFGVTLCYLMAESSAITADGKEQNEEHREGGG